ncbi:3-hydroxyacyl-CoA dehydrogenase NAD-binding domain-containing protein [Massilia sp. Bi118]|uniref:3-hydroxyacyl-CoA dehydrogenase NAD-binding domain-containing protein n=1 Tax=Massilia sp. Bi118 TaxID=2822346 RepID=UPI001E33F29D|nr:3-hydroxyacyl-CoA dehydrogenase NAD-binding domain-containing protein [Massilia sp. Bi118]
MNDETCDIVARATRGCGKPPLAARVGIIGAGTSGVSLAVNFLNAGIPVTLFEVERILLDEGIASAGDQRMFLLSGTLELHHLKDCDLILQVSEDAGADLFQRLGEFAKPGAILVTTTLEPKASYIAGFTRRPDAVPDALFAGTSRACIAWQFVCRNGTTAETLSSAIVLSRALCNEAKLGEVYVGSARGLRGAGIPAPRR